MFSQSGFRASTWPRFRSSCCGLPSLYRFENSRFSEALGIRGSTSCLAHQPPDAWRIGECESVVQDINIVVAATWNRPPTPLQHAAVLGRVQGLRCAPTPLRVAPWRPGPGLRAAPRDSVYRRRPTCVLDGSIATSTAHNSRRPLRRVALVQLAVCVTRSSRWRLRHAQRTGRVRARTAACRAASHTSARRPMAWCDRICVPRSGSHLASS